jgi:O-antigen ligase
MGLAAMPVLPVVSVASAEIANSRVKATVISRWELAALFVVLILFTEGVLPRLLTSGGNPEASSLLRILWLPVYGLALAGALWKAKAFAVTALKMPFLIVLTGLGLFSFLWSIDPALSQRRGIAIMATTLAGIFMGIRYDWRTLLRVLGLVWITVAVLSFLTALLVPSFGVMYEIHVGAWKGLFYEKNQMGGHMARAAFLCGFLFIMDAPWRRIWGAGVFLCVLLVLLSTSKTSLLGLLLGFAILGAGMWMKRGVVTGMTSAWLGVVLAGTFACVMVLAPEVIFTALGRDPSLTGRTDIWATLIDMINARPLLGYGYGAFWAAESEPAYWVRVLVEWDAPTAHNGWVEVAIALGLIGLVCLILDFMMTIYRAARASVDTWTGVFALGVCAQFLLFSLSESISLQQNAIVWVTYVAVATKLANRPRRVLPVRGVNVRRSLRRLTADGS